jgi:hypothetical protein
MSPRLGLLPPRIVQASPSVYGADMENVEAMSRLASVLDVCEYVWINGDVSGTLMPDADRDTR